MWLSPVTMGLGVMSWSASEYFLHRFVGHGPRRRVPAGALGAISPAGLAARFNEEHIAHHGDPRYFLPTSQKVMAGAAVVTAISTLGTLVVGPRIAASFALGLGAMYATYEVLHRRIHTHPPRGTLSRWVRLHHLAHHHKSPKTNHGVTSNLWDRALGTEAGIGPLRIPAKLAPAWLCDDATGQVKPEFQGDYALVGARVVANPSQNQGDELEPRA